MPNVRSLPIRLLVAALLFAVVSMPSSAQNAPRFNLVLNGDFESTLPSSPQSEDFVTTGNVTYGVLGNPEEELNGSGFRLNSSPSASAGSVTTTVTVPPGSNRWFRFRVRGLAQKGFSVGSDELTLKAEFYIHGGADYLDNIASQIYNQVKLDRASLIDPGTNKNLGPSTWRSYDLDFKTPFPNVDTIKLSVAFADGDGTAQKSEFWISSISLTPIDVPSSYVAPSGGGVYLGKDQITRMVPLGGRWYYDPQGGSRTPPAQFDYRNSNRVLYLSDRLETPFAGNMTAWLRKGDVDLDGNIVQSDSFVADNVVVRFTSDSLVIHSKNLPNHPTAVFPDTDNLLDSNPNRIREQLSTWYIPLKPSESPSHFAMENGQNVRGALPMGPIGVACNGIVFFNPFDAGNTVALWRVDRCCGHPAPNGQYHYHKYPVCTKSPWSDNGDDHSPLIGFAFDGYPIYGPFESKGVLAKDDKVNPLNAFNIHYDSERGWHYHVTPGQFPHIIGGYWGSRDPRDGSPNMGM